MAQAPRRTTIRGPAFIHLLAGLTRSDAPQPRLSPSDRLSQWLDWTHAVALSTALDGKPPAAAADASPLDDASEACARVRASLSASITADRAFGVAGPAETPQHAAAPPDASFFQQRYLAIQRSMTASIGHLRGRLREQLTSGSPMLARLAAVDATMEAALATRERQLWSTVPLLLTRHYEQLRQAALPAAAEENAEASAVPETAGAEPGTWLDVFRRDMQNILLAELDVRLQPAEGLLSALRAH